ncbi:hypothetical protein B0T16DRAFT_415633 [Cercophora newfieldiana]|uniref:Uncharacterized protein n=1 Tax=Cercophora newfieldiana TaxID=92897 RepID=A0AA39XZQ7_9PEZI|nr:hypothetical protein B0T16DRAFT_415633 [Cercophora newfieldiana]
MKGDYCSNENECDNDWVCRNNVCARPAVTTTVWAAPSTTQGGRVSTVYFTVWGRAEATGAA